MPPKRIRLKCGFSLGDIVALTGAVRELSEQYPGQFSIDVDTSAGELWWHNPYITPVKGDATVIDCNRVIIDRTGRTGRHYIAAYLDLLNNTLGTCARLHQVAGDIHLSEDERDWHSDLWTICRQEIPFWIVCSGGKFDLPIKWWGHDRYQRVVDHFRGRIQFVQVGTWGNFHPPIAGAVDLRGRTGIRDLVHLVYYAQGVLCGVTSLMHLAAAVPTESGTPRQAVIIAGAREPEAWEKYPGHHFLHTANQVECGACWKHGHIDIPGARTRASEVLRCGNISGDLPKCMDLIGSNDVIDHIESMIGSGTIQPLSKLQSRAARRAVSKCAAKNDFDEHNVHPLNAVAQADSFIARIRPYPQRRFAGKGVVICGGGASYFTNAWVCIKMLRVLGCELPVELWYLGRSELDRKMEFLLAPLGVRSVNARELMARYPMRNPLGWELKSYALLHSRFEEMLLLDADNVAVVNPEFLFDCPEYQRTGAVFWPDYRCLGSRRSIWKHCGIQYRHEPEFESGQMLINKRKCWAALNLSFWYNDHSEFFYQHVHGDKETFHMAWRKLKQEYSMVPVPIKKLPFTMCQHDFRGNRLFQHRNLDKWQLFGANKPIAGFLHEDRCLAFLEELRKIWDGKIQGRRETLRLYGMKFRKGTFDLTVFENVVFHNEYNLPESFSPEDVILDVGAHIGSFAIACHTRGSRSIICFEPNRENVELARENLKGLPGIRLMNKAVLDRKGRVAVQPFPRASLGQNTGGSSVILDASGEVQAVALDDLLRRLGRVRLLKLDCEGSEWPILLYSRELWRVQEIRGEFHQLADDELCPEDSHLDCKVLRKRLQGLFTQVETTLDRNNPQLGKFAASRPKPSPPDAAQFGLFTSPRSSQKAAA